MPQPIDVVQGGQFAAARRPELIAVEVASQGLFLKGLDQFSELSPRFQPFCDAQGVKVGHSGEVKTSQLHGAEQACNKVLNQFSFDFPVIQL